jgi:hypothetical protein
MYGVIDLGFADEELAWPVRVYLLSTQAEMEDLARSLSEDEDRKVCRLFSEDIYVSSRVTG